MCMYASESHHKDECRLTVQRSTVQSNVYIDKLLITWTHAESHMSVTVQSVGTDVRLKTRNAS